MSGPSPIPDETFNALVDRRLPPKTEREVRQRVDADPQAAARVATWQRQSEALSAAFAPIAHEPLPLSILLKLQAVKPSWRPDSKLLRIAVAFTLGVACGIALAWIAFRYLKL